MSAKPTTGHRRWRRIINVIALAGTALALVAALFVLWLTATAGGAAFALAQIGKRVPGELSYDGVEGSLAEDLRIARLTWRDGETGVEIADFSLRLRARALLSRTLLIEQLSASAVRVSSGPDDAAPPGPLAVPEISLPLDLVVRRLVVGQLTLAGDDGPIDLGGVELTGTMRGASLQLKNLSAGPDAWRVAVSGKLSASGDYPLDMRIDWQLPAQSLTGQGRVSGSLARLGVEHQLNGDYPVATRGALELLGRSEPFVDLVHTCAEGCGTDELTLADLRLAHSGTLNDYRFELGGTASGGGFAATRFAASGQGTLTSATFERLTGEGDTVALDVSGSAQWGEAPRFTITGRFSDLNAALLGTGLSGRIGGRIDATGSNAQTFRASLDQVRGELNGYALTARGEISRDGEVFDVREVAIGIGDNTLGGSGRLQARQLEAQFAVAAPAIEQIHADLQGSLDATGRLAGTLDAPSVTLELGGRALAFAEWRVRDLNIDLRSDIDGRADGRVTLAGIESQGRDLGSVDLTATGPPDALVVDLSWAVGEHRVALELETALNLQGARGTVRRGEFELAPIGTWQLDRPFAFGVEPGRTSIGTHEWVSGNGAMRIDALDVSPDAIRLAVQLANMPLESVASFLPQALELDGRADAAVDLTRSDGMWRGTLDWQQSQTRIVLDALGAREEVRLSRVDVDGRLDGRDGLLTVTVGGDGGMTGDGRLAIRQDDGALRIDGGARVEISELGWLSAFAPGAADIDGRFELQVKASGDMASPSLQGRIDWLDGAVTLTDLGVRLTDINVKGSGDSINEIAFNGTARAADGELGVAGDIRDLLGEARQITLTVKGEDARVIDWQDQTIWVSPNLSLGMTREGATVSGKLTVPRAEIRVKKLPESAVARSADVRVAGREQESGFALALSGKVDVSMGENVHVVAFGLDTRVRGDVALSLMPNKEPRLDGRLFLQDGLFAAYGQKLKVDRGNFIYAGPPDNPVLDVQATRRISQSGGDVLAGVRVSGFARDPLIEIYSEPTLPETEALAYLLLGRGSFDGAGADGQLLSQAALSLGLSKSSPVSAGVAAGLGLDEFSVVGGDLATAELVAGKRLSDDLYVRYSLGVFSEIGTLFLRYRLSERLRLEAGASDAQSLDLLYSIEK